MARFKIIEKAVDAETLCATCENGLVWQRRTGDVVAHCTYGCGHPQQVPVDIARCTDYRNKNQTSRYDMEKIAWEIKHDRSGQAVGFAPPKKKRDDD